MLLSSGVVVVVEKSALTERRTGVSSSSSVFGAWRKYATAGSGGYFERSGGGPFRSSIMRRSAAMRASSSPRPLCLIDSVVHVNDIGTRANIAAEVSATGMLHMVDSLALRCQPTSRRLGEFGLQLRGTDPRCSERTRLHLQGSLLIQESLAFARISMLELVVDVPDRLPDVVSAIHLANNTALQSCGPRTGRVSSRSGDGKQYC